MGIFYTGEHEKLYSEITPAVACVGANPCANLKASVAALKSKLSGLSVEDIWSDSAHKEFNSNKSSIVTKLGNMITSISNAFEPSEQIYVNLERELKILKDADERYQQLLKNEPQRSQFTTEDSKGNEIFDSSAYNAAHAEWERQKKQLEDFCKKCQENIKNMETTLASIDATTVEGSLSISFGVPAFTPKSWGEIMKAETSGVIFEDFDEKPIDGLEYGTNYYTNEKGELCFDSLDTFKLYATAYNLPSTNPDELSGTYNIAGYTSGFTYNSETANKNTVSSTTANGDLTFYRDSEGNIVQVSGLITPIDPNSKTLVQDVNNVYTAANTYVSQLDADIDALYNARDALNTQLLNSTNGTIEQRAAISQKITTIDTQIECRQDTINKIEKEIKDGWVFDGKFHDVYELTLEPTPDTAKIIEQAPKINKALEEINNNLSQMQPVYTMTDGITPVEIITSETTTTSN